MRAQTFSRSFLQGLRDQHKQQYIDRIIVPFINGIRATALLGNTLYMCDYIGAYDEYKKRNDPTMPALTDDDFLSALQQTYPDSNVSYLQEIRADVVPNKKVIIVDWS